MMLNGGALFGLDQILRDGYQYKKTGVMLMVLSDAAARQGSISSITQSLMGAQHG